MQRDLRWGATRPFDGVGGFMPGVERTAEAEKHPGAFFFYLHT